MTVAINGKAVEMLGGVLGGCSGGALLPGVAGVMKGGGVGSGGGGSSEIFGLFLEERLVLREDLKNLFPPFPLLLLFVLFLLSVDFIDVRSGLVERWLDEPKTSRSFRPVDDLEGLRLRCGADRVVDRLAGRLRRSEVFSELAVELLSLKMDPSWAADCSERGASETVIAGDNPL